MKLLEKDMSATEKEREEKEKKRAETRAKVKEETERQKAEKDKESVSERQKARADEYKKSKRTEQMTYEEFKKRRLAGESVEDLKKEYDQFESDQKLATPGGFSSQPTTQELAMMAAAEHYGNPSNSGRLSGAVKTYKALEGEARDILRQNRNPNVAPDEEFDNNFINMYIEAMYNNPDVSLDSVRNTMQAMRNSNGEAAEVAGENNKVNEFTAAAARAFTPYGLPSYGVPSGATNPQSSSVQPTESSYLPMGWSASNPMPQVPNTGDPTLPYMNTGTESTGYKPTTTLH